jgi:hypothetical protein
VNPANAGTVSGGGRFICDVDSFRIIEAIPNSYCYQFMYWTDNNGTIISYKPKDTLNIY